MTKWREKANKAYSENFLWQATNKIFRPLAGASIVVMLIVTVITVAIRKLPIPGGWARGGHEITEIGMLILVSFAIGYSWYVGSHIRIGLFRDRMSIRKKAILDTVSAFFGMLFFAMIFIAMWNLASWSQGHAITTELRNIPTAPLQFGSAILFVHACLVLMRSCVGLAAKASGSQFGHEPYLQRQ